MSGWILSIACPRMIFTSFFLVFQTMFGDRYGDEVYWIPWELGSDKVVGQFCISTPTLGIYLILLIPLFPY
ncbi:hypothetical protein EDB81DRAFT_177063 [Dactylonectria macrodidyma]|uniref:Uncharacterized protein n=1 Tax=Dactylonectria macrodidyma TaxID=307937 RepID=A0A9P9JLB9_9HYPO|nr:hypothetical protein EDB81DRAFT_177063 [Dactylonectria macrodidyma]